MKHEAFFTPLDLLTAKTIAAEIGTDDADLHLLFSYVAAAFRHGYLFVKPVDPPLALLCEELPSDELEKALCDGFTKFQEQAIASRYLVYEDEKLYVQRAKLLLGTLQSLYQQLQMGEPRLALNLEVIEKELGHLQESNKLLAEQAKAILAAASSTLSCIWGGPGTGKTYTAGWLASLFLAQHPKAKIALAAPTGKAAANLKQSIQRVVDPSLHGSFVAKTLHSLLGLRRFGQKARKEELGFDLLLVDECSMIDIELMCKLFSQVAAGSRLVLLGDPHQLPPVEPGEPFCAIVREKEQQKSPGFLVKTKRQEEGAILQLAAAVREGRVDEALFLLQNENEIQWLGEETALTPTIEHVKSLYIRTPETIAGQFAQLNRLRLLCPLREGRDGSVAINQKIVRAMKGGSYEPIQITKNDSQLGLTNGQVGLLQHDLAYFEDPEEPSGYRAIPKILLPAYETAYCLSVHKSQGSEFEEVVLFLPEGSERFGRKMLYTAITRAKKRFCLIGKHEVLRACIAHDGRKVTTFFTLS